MQIWGVKGYLEGVMYAIIRTGGKQYHVAAGERLRVEKLAGNIGDSIVIDDVLMVGDGDNVKFGQPVLEGAKVNAKILEQDKAKKVLVFKKKKRKGYQVMKGHRQLFTRLEIQDIQA
jgi:large subunit ribosomal protein L21